MACENQISSEDLENAKSDTVTIAEVATSREGGVSSGAPITQSTNRFGETTDTLQGRLDKLGVIYDDPIRNWSASLLVSDLRAHRYPADTGEVYIPTAPLPFTTGASFDINNWALYQGLTSDDLINDLTQAYEFPTVAALKASVSFPEGKLVKTNGYYDGWATLLEPQGSASYLITSLQNVRDTLGDPAWVPDEYGDHTRFDGSIAMLQKGSSIKVEQYGVKKDGTDDSAAMQAALATGLNVECGAGTISLADTIAIKFNGQALYGHGTYNTTLEWIGTDNTKNMVELWSGRRDLLNNGLATTNQRLENFKISTRTGSFIQNLIWVEAGCFHGWIEKIRGFDIRGAIPTEAIMKLDSNGGQSYCLGMNFRDIVLTGGANDTGLPVPRGIWIESIIEGYFESVKVYTTQIGWQLGTPDTDNVRNIANTTFMHCQSEIGDRGYADDNGRALVIYQARDINFYGCKIVSGADFEALSGQIPIRFLGVDGFQNKNVTFDKCTIWGFEHRSENAMQFTSTANYQAIRFKGCEFYQVNGALVVVEGGNIPTIYFDNDCNYVECEATISDFRLESHKRTSTTVNNADGATIGLQSGNDTTQIKKESAILTGYNADTQGLMMSAYKFSRQQARIRAYNRTGANITIPDGYAYTREIDNHNSSRRGRKNYNVPNLVVGDSVSTDIVVSGAQLGDFVAVNFSLNNDGLSVFGYVSAPDIVTVMLVNRSGSIKDLDTGVLSAYVIDSIFTQSAKTLYDMPSLTANAGVTTTMALSGAKLGDIVVPSLSVDQQGIIAYAWVSAADVISIRFQNESGGVVDLANAVLKVGLIETPTSI